MKNSHFSFKTADEQTVFVHKWLPESDIQVKAVVQIAHGMAEHSARYEEFATYLTKAGFVVYANDHRGHGKTAGSIENQGFFAEKDGWLKVVEDMYQLTNIIKKENQGKPVIIFGHSMGSLLTRTYITLHSKDINGVILSATSGESGLLIKMAKGISKSLGFFTHKKNPSNLLDNMSFGKFNSYFKPNRTKFDWLSRDNNNVDKYIADPYCGAIFSNRFFYDLSWGVDYNNQKKNIEKISKDLSILLISGEKDPVGNFTKGVQKVYDIYKSLYINNVKLKFYKDARHEIVNEINRQEIYNDVIEWINSLQ